jgi:hypothetical protein
MIFRTDIAGACLREYNEGGSPNMNREMKK